MNYSILRHGGRRTDSWREVHRGDDFAAALSAYEKIAAALRQGGAQLWREDDRGRNCLWRCWAPRLRTRW